jgi:hypothetical protein
MHLPEYIHNHDHAIPCHAIWKELFEEVIFSSNVIKNPKSSRDRALKKEKKERKRKKAPRVSSNKRGSQYFERRKTLQLQKSFLMWFHFLPLHHTISKTLSKIIEKVFLTLVGPSFSLAIYMNWVVPFLFTHELHIFSL